MLNLNTRTLTKVRVSMQECTVNATAWLMYSIFIAETCVLVRAAARRCACMQVCVRTGSVGRVNAKESAAGYPSL